MVLKSAQILKWAGEEERMTVTAKKALVEGNSGVDPPTIKLVFQTIKEK